MGRLYEAREADRSDKRNLLFSGVANQERSRSEHFFNEIVGVNDERKLWCELLERNDLRYHSVKVANCNRDILFFNRCSYDPRHYKKPIYDHCFDRAYCDDCASATARKNAWITYNWILENIAKNLRFNLYVLRFDLTFPHEFDDTPEDKIRAMVSQFMTFLKSNDDGYLDDEPNDDGYLPDERIGYLYVIHRFGSNKNIFNRHLNVHVYALNAFIQNGQFKRARPWANEARAKRIWGYLLQEELGWTDYVDKNPDLRVRYIPFYKVNDKNGKRLTEPYACDVGKHLLTLRYMYRYPVVDVAKVFRAGNLPSYLVGGESGRSPVYVQLTSAVGLREVLESHHKVVWMGYLANSKKESTVRLLTEKSIPLAQIIRHLPEKRCPECDSALIPEWSHEETVHNEAEIEAQYMQENDWGKEEEKEIKQTIRAWEEPAYREATDEDLNDWKQRDSLNEDDSERARRARSNGW